MWQASLLVVIDTQMGNAMSHVHPTEQIPLHAVNLLKRDLLSRMYLGHVTAHLHVIEYPKRGLPHANIPTHTSWVAYSNAYGQQQQQQQSGMRSGTYKRRRMLLHTLTPCIWLMTEISTAQAESPCARSWHAWFEGNESSTNVSVFRGKMFS